MAEAGGRDALGTAFFGLHIAIVVYVLIGWALPCVGLYLMFLPLMVLHWPLNRNTCIINNLESWIRNGRWRDPGNCEEGAWLRMVIRGATGVELTVRQTDWAVHSLLTGLWGLGLWHWLGW